MTREMRFRIREKDAGRAAGSFLAARFTYHSPDEWAQRMREGRVRVNGRPTEPDAPLRIGDEVSYDASGIPEPPVDARVDVVLEDAFLLVLNKSGNLPCHPGGRYFNHTLWAVVKERFGVPNPVLVNRIDRETSGLVIVAKTPEAARNLWSQFMRRAVEKRYTVFVEGSFPERMAATGWLTANSGSAIRKKRLFTTAEEGGPAPAGDAEWAETDFERMGQSDAFSVLTARPRTGRLHQIRATLLSLGFPVVGDKLYGVDETVFLRFCADEMTQEDRRRMRLGRQALHACRLDFRHPRFGHPVECRAELPPDMGDMLTSGGVMNVGRTFD